jgi:hypothetical protein
MAAPAAVPTTAPSVTVAELVELDLELLDPEPVMPPALAVLKLETV